MGYKFNLKKGYPSLMFILLHNCFVIQGAVEGNDFQYWSRYQFKLYTSDKVSAVLYTEARLYDDFGKLGLFLFSPRIIYKLHNNLDLHMNYTYLKVRNNQNDFITQYRIEPEINPHFTIYNRIKIDFRNRVEFRHIENKGWNNNRYRGRARLTLRLKDFGFLRSVFSDTEFFYDFASLEHLEQWTTPLGVNMSIVKHADMQLFYMIQHKKGAEDWFSNQIIGTMLTVKF